MILVGFVLRFEYSNKEFNGFLYDLGVMFGNGLFMNCAVYLNMPMVLVMLMLTVRILVQRRPCMHRTQRCTLHGGLKVEPYAYTVERM